MSAPPVVRLMDEFKQDMMAMREYELVSVDDTVKICMPVQGQNLPRRSTRYKPRPTIFESDEVCRCVFTTRGRNGCLLGLSKRNDNKDATVVEVLKDAVPLDAVCQLRFVCSDRCGHELHQSLARVFPTSNCWHWTPHTLPLCSNMHSCARRHLDRSYYEQS